MFVASYGLWYVELVTLGAMGRLFDPQFVSGEAEATVRSGGSPPCPRLSKEVRLHPYKRGAHESYPLVIWHSHGKLPFLVS